MKKILVFFAAAFSIVSLPAQNNPEWLKTAAFYHCYPSSFQDSDGNGIGDIKGIQSRLDYIQSIGLNAIWIPPLFKSAFKDGGYDVIDYYLIDPRFGTNTDLVNLVKEAHKRGMHILLDLVAGHSSDQSEWFKQSKEADANQRYSDYYIWAPFKPDNLNKMEASKWVEANAPRAKYYIKNYYDSQPALNYGYAHPNPAHPWEQSVDAPGPQAVRRELKNIITFWMEKGVDGFRVDMAMSLVKNDFDSSATIALWQEINSWFDHKFPNGMLLAEWFNPKQAIKAGFDMDFLPAFTLYQTLTMFYQKTEKVYFDKAGEGGISDWYKSFKDNYESSLNKGYIAVPTDNADSPRIAIAGRDDGKQLKGMMTFFLTMPGVPIVYYGDEIGLRYMPDWPDTEGSLERSGCRTPMQWDDSPNAGFSTAPKEGIYIPQDPDPNRPTVAKQDKDPNSLLNFVRALLKLRASSAALSNDGDWKLISDVNNPYPMVYMRSKGNEKYIIGINPANRKVEAEFPTLGAGRVAYKMGTDEKCAYKTGQNVDNVTMPAISAVIFKIE